MPQYALRLMFEWGGGCLWCGNDTARDRFGVGPVEDCLPLGPDTRRRLEQLSRWHDGALDWKYPPDPSPWLPDEWERFGRAATDLLAVIRAELGSDFDVTYGSGEQPR